MPGTNSIVQFRFELPGSDDLKFLRAQGPPGNRDSESWYGRAICRSFLALAVGLAIHRVTGIVAPSSIPRATT